jgi:1,4-alpha-glucan branching enzyme
MTADGVKFQYYAPGASRVQLAGNWPENNWARGDGSVGEADIGLMTVDDRGMWEIVVPLDVGRYYYVFWVDDNRYRTDPGNPEEVEFGPHGRSSMLVVFLEGGKLEIR